MGLRTKIALGVTGLYLAGLALVIFFRFCELLRLDLNSLGDFLAGAFGPLALAWVVFGYFQQGEELRNSSNELKQSVAELKRQSDTAQYQFEHEKIIAEDRIKSHKKSISPDFILSYDRFNDGGRDKSAVFSIINYGAAVRDVEVSIIDGGLTCIAHKCDFFGPKETVEFSAYWSRNSDSEPVDIFSILISFRDSDSEVGTFEYKGRVQRTSMTSFRSLSLHKAT